MKLKSVTDDEVDTCILAVLLYFCLGCDNCLGIFVIYPRSIEELLGLTLYQGNVL